LDRTGKTPYDLQYRLLRKNGKYGHYHASGATLRNDEGVALRVVGSLRDISSMKNLVEVAHKSKIQIEEKANWYEFMLNTIEEPISVTDMDKKVTFINKAGLDLLGKTREEVTGKFCGDVWGVEICKDERCGIECMKRGEGKSYFQVGDQKFSTSASYMKDLNGNNIGHLEVVSLVSDASKDTRNQKPTEKERADLGVIAANADKMQKVVKQMGKTKK
jgi:PAS domain-containing protein